VWNKRGLLGTNDVRCLKTFRSLQQIKLHSFPLVQGTVSVLLDRGEVYENIFPCRSLDKAVTFGPVEPLHCSFLSHKTLLSLL